MDLTELTSRIKEVSQEFPRLPAAITRLLGILEQDQAGPEQIVEAIQADPGLTTKILRVANSAYYGFPSAIADLNRAVPLIGLDMVRSLALSVAALEGLTASRANTSLDREALWLHCLGVGSLMTEMARGLGYRAQHLFILGFLHDIGKLVLDKFFADQFQPCLDLALAQDLPLWKAEQRLLGQDHGFFGAALLSKWLFPSTIIRPVRVHHQMESAERSMDLVMLRVADALVGPTLDPGPDSPARPAPRPEDLAYLKLTSQQLTHLDAHLTTCRPGLADLLAAMG